jgi:FkbM family methyltransferase
VLDLGGNVGLYALYVAAANARVRIFSFEPSSENLALFRQNLDRNPRQAGQINVFPMALGPYNGTATLSLDRSPAEYAIVDREEDARRTEQVRCVDLATALDMMQVDEFDLVKIDIEGAEAGLLESATDEQLRRFKAVVLEWHYSMEELEDLAGRFRSAGFDAKPVLLEGHMRFLHAYRRP